MIDMNWSYCYWYVGRRRKKSNVLHCCCQLTECVTRCIAATCCWTSCKQLLCRAQNPKYFVGALSSCIAFKVITIDAFSDACLEGGPHEWHRVLACECELWSTAAMACLLVSLYLFRFLSIRVRSKNLGYFSPFFFSLFLSYFLIEHTSANFIRSSSLRQLGSGGRSLSSLCALKGSSAVARLVFIIHFLLLLLLAFPISHLRFYRKTSHLVLHTDLCTDLFLGGEGFCTQN